MRLFSRADSNTTRQTIDLFREELRNDKRAARKFLIVIPLAHFLRYVAIPLLISYLIQSLITHPHNLQTPIKLLIATGIVMALATICNNKGYTALYNHEELAQTRLLQKGLDYLMGQSYHFFTEQKVGSLSGDLMNFSKSYMTIFDAYFHNANHLIVSFVASLIIIAFIAPALLLPLLIIIGVILFTSVHSLQSRSEYRNERKRLTSELAGNISDILGNQILVRVFATEKRESQLIMRQRAKIEKISYSEIKVVEQESLSRQVAVFSFQLISLGAFIWLFGHSKLSIAGLIFTYTYLSRTTDSMFGIASLIRSFEQAFLDAAPITSLLSEPSTVADIPNASTFKITNGKIQLQKVRFSYGDNDDAIFNKLELSIKSGERIGLAGPSGGGKSTLTKLLLRFADLESGKILIDGQDISAVTQASLRSQIAYVPQEPYLFHRSLRDNIAYGSADVTDEQVIDAARRAHSLEFIDKLPNGLNTIVGERGVKLSGGQRQRIAIARAILKDAPILILDEATSALDSESEQLIQESLDELMKDRTSIVIAHRLSTIAKLDRVIVLNNGEIVEDGSHKSLLKQKGLYARLWARQSGGFIED